MARQDMTLGTLLRLLLDRLDRDVEKAYRLSGLRCKPRYKVIMAMLLENGEMKMGEIVSKTGLSQPSISNTLAAMRRDELVEVRKGDDARERLVSLTAAARDQRIALERQWQLTAQAAASLDGELGISLEEELRRALGLLEERSFLDRILAAQSSRRFRMTTEFTARPPVGRS